MKEIDGIVQNLESDIECVTAVEQKQHYRKIGSIKIKPGHTIFGLNLTTGELKPVEYDVKAPELNIATGEEYSRKRAKYDQHTEYFSSLNVKNAEKKANKIIGAIKAKTEFLKDHQHLIVSNLPFWGELERMGFQEYSDTMRTIAGFAFNVMFLDGKKEDMLIISIIPTITKEHGNAYQFVYDNQMAEIPETEMSLPYVVSATLDSLNDLHKLFTDFNSAKERKKLISIQSLDTLELLIKSFKLKKNETI